MTDPTPFTRLLGERVRRMIVAQGRSQESVAVEAGITTSALQFLLKGGNSTISTVMAVLYELDAGQSDIDAVYADFAEWKRERADG